MRATLRSIRPFVGSLASARERPATLDPKWHASTAESLQNLATPLKLTRHHFKDLSHYTRALLSFVKVRLISIHTHTHTRTLVPGGREECICSYHNKCNYTGYLMSFFSCVFFFFPLSFCIFSTRASSVYN